jgi:MOSC domain-containing protein YiiM
MNGSVIAVSCDSVHRFSKRNQSAIRLIAGFGVEGDAHAGSTVRHLYLAKRDPTIPNLRQVHLIHAELHDELKEIGFVIEPGELGENLTTRGIDLLGLPLGTLLYLGAGAVVELTGLRTPCSHIDRFRRGLKRAMIVKRPGMPITFKTGVMGVVRATGFVKRDDKIWTELPKKPWTPLPFL